jgi:hypothetical protein
MIPDRIFALTVRWIDHQFTEMEKEFGVVIPSEERQECARYCLKRDLTVDAIGLVWVRLYGVKIARDSQREMPAPPGFWPYKEDHPC